jgi:hypothetical protein
LSRLDRKTRMRVRDAFWLAVVPEVYRMISGSSAEVGSAR